eukprot:TRINITY_DN113697_c0_g1_i1.p1 TRINITY_DN113697_c0_g1~~TRINITY_DN113697_c0_g1_i1.p1  ORF type:complete len:486 (-),score=161.41 TRINITY_DN113697_c0_g1_i1:178-1635(-)
MRQVLLIALLLGHVASVRFGESDEEAESVSDFADRLREGDEPDDSLKVGAQPAAAGDNLGDLVQVQQHQEVDEQEDEEDDAEEDAEEGDLSDGQGGKGGKGKTKKKGKGKWSLGGMLNSAKKEAKKLVGLGDDDDDDKGAPVKDSKKDKDQDERHGDDVAPGDEAPEPVSGRETPKRDMPAKKNIVKKPPPKEGVDPVLNGPPDHEQEHDGGYGAKPGSVSWCDSCKGTSERCHFPPWKAFEQSWKGPKMTVAFPTSDNFGCRAQANHRKRFDNVDLSIHEQFDQDCTWKAMAPSYQKDTTGPALEANLAASQKEMEGMKMKCKAAAEYMTGGKKNIIILAYDDTYKGEMKKLLEGKNSSETLMGYHVLAVESTQDLLKNFDERAFLDHPKDSALMPMNMGGSVQINALMAQGQVAALFYFHAYQQECHRCDISATIQACRGAKQYINKDMFCSFDLKKAKKVMAKLREKVCKDNICKKVWAGGR